MGALPPATRVPGASPRDIYETNKALQLLLIKIDEADFAVQAGTPMTANGEAPAVRKPVGVNPVHPSSFLKYPRRRPRPAQSARSAGTMQAPRHDKPCAASKGRARGK